MKLVRFGEFELDAGARELRRKGRLVRLQRQPFQLLELLLARPGEVVTRDELRQEIWADDIFVEFDNALNASVAKLREALGDSASNPRFIQTVPRQGYRFVAPVTSGPPPARRPTWTRALAIVAVAGALVGVVAVSRQSQPPPLKPTPLTYYAGMENEPAFSPDGNQIAFTWDGPTQDNFDVYIKTIRGPEPVRRTTHPNRDFSPAWSPDGQWLAFMRRFGAEAAWVYRIPVLGGPEERLAEVNTGSKFSGGSRAHYQRYLCWAADSGSLIVVDRDDGQAAPSLFLLSMETGQQRRLTRAPRGSLGDRDPALSPDGKTLAFVGSRGNNTGVFLLRLADGFVPVGEPEFLRSPASPSPGGFAIAPTWTGQPRELVAFHDSQLWRFNVRNPQQREPLGLFVGQWWSMLAVAPSARRLAYSVVLGNANVYRLDLEDGVVMPEPVPLTSTSSAEVNARHSPDGAQIVFQAFHRDATLWIANLDGSHERPLTTLKGGSPRWSPDGKLVVCDAPSSPDRREDSDLWLVNVQSGSYRRLTQGPSDDHVPNWSRDGKWVYFCRRDEQQIWKIEVATGQEVRVTQHGGFYPVESTDGRFLYYTKAQFDRSVWRVRVNGGEEVQILGPVVSWCSFDLTDRGIYYAPRAADGRSAVWFLDFTDGSKTLVYAPAKPVTNGFSIAPDGKSILLSLIDEDNSDLMLVEGFE